MDGQTSRAVKGSLDGSLPAGFKFVRRLVIDIEAPGMRDAISDAVDRINRSEEVEHMQAELDASLAEAWTLLPE